MLDFAQLKTPARHGDVLVDPAPDRWIRLARQTNASLRGGNTIIAGRPLSFWRQATREAILGTDDCLVFALGHQPEFIHAGVWAKHVVAVRAAAACDGVAVNVIVDSDVPHRTGLRIPVFGREAARIEQVHPFNAPAGAAHEQFLALTAEQSRDFDTRTAELMGARYGESLMPAYQTALRNGEKGRDWVDQAVAARRAIEKPFGVELRERRISEYWCTPLVIDMLQNADRFAQSYNGALARYRREHGVRGAQRPMPDLSRVGGRTELPQWVWRRGESRRRLFVVRRVGITELFAEESKIGEFADAELESCEQLRRITTDADGWQLRPRALALTIWARLLLADLFIHGIGGAKYDRISDTIIADYYGIQPPHMACVSATLHLGWVDSHLGTDIATARRMVRDVTWNPQRFAADDSRVRTLIARRAEAVQTSTALRRSDPHDHLRRRRVFDDIRDISRRILDAAPDLATTLRTTLQQAVDSQRWSEVARGREFFFGLHGRDNIAGLVSALPGVGAFRL